MNSIGSYPVGLLAHTSHTLPLTYLQRVWTLLHFSNSFLRISLQSGRVRYWIRVHHHLNRNWKSLCICWLDNGRISTPEWSRLERKVGKESSFLNRWAMLVRWVGSGCHTSTFQCFSCSWMDNCQHQVLRIRCYSCLQVLIALSRYPTNLHPWEYDLPENFSRVQDKEVCQGYARQT